MVGGVDNIFTVKCKLASLCFLKCLFKARGCNFDPINLKFSGYEYMKINLNTRISYFSSKLSEGFECEV